MTLFMSTGTDVVTHTCSVLIVSISDKHILLPAVAKFPHIPVKPVLSVPAATIHTMIHNILRKGLTTSKLLYSHLAL